MFAQRGQKNKEYGNENNNNNNNNNNGEYLVPGTERHTISGVDFTTVGKQAICL